MSGPGAADDGRHRALAGLLEKLMAAVRPEFRAGVVVFDPADPVFGGDACRVPQCGRTARTVGMCYGHHQRWVHAGRPGPGAFAVSEDAAVPWFGHAPLAGCKVPGCGFGSDRQRLCSRHLRAWQRSGEPDGDGWIAGLPAAVPDAGQERLPGQLLPALGASGIRLVLLPPPAAATARLPGPGGIHRRLRPAS